MALDETEIIRARLYGLLGALLAAPPEDDLLFRVGSIEGADGPLGTALADLAAAARATSASDVQREYGALFIGVVRGELVPYASYYLTGFLHEKPLARLRQDMAALGIARADKNPDPEDHAGSLCEMMAGLIVGAFGGSDAVASPLLLQRTFFERHLLPWVGQFFTDLELAASASFYKAVGATGRLFIDVEENAFALAAA